MLTVGGNISPASNISVEEIPIYLDGTGMPPVMTDTEGNYSFEELELNASFTIRPAYNERKRDEVSTLDLVKISRHLIGIEPFVSPYQWLAADADYSGEVNTFDLIALQNVLLFNIDDFPGGNAWRFVAGNYEFENPDFPLEESIQETIFVEELGIDEAAKDFMAVKVGDVSSLGNASTEAVNRSVHSAVIADLEVEKGTALEIPVFLNPQSEINGLQLNFGTKNRGIQINGLIPVQLEPATHLKDNNLMLSWIDGGGVPLREHMAAFKLQIEVNKTGMLSDFLDLKFDKGPNEIVLDGDQVNNISLEFETNIETNVLIEQELPFLFPNRPNPFRNETQIRFTLPESGVTVIEISDFTGRVLFRREAVLKGGYHEMMLSSEELDSEGVLYFKLITDQGTATQTMLLVKD